MRVGLVSGDLKPLTQAMNRIGKDAKPVFRDVGDAVAKVAARDIGVEAGRFSRQARAAAKGVESRRDRVPYVHTKARTPFSTPKTKLGKVVQTAEFGSKPGSRRHYQWTRRAGSGQPVRWNPTGWWFFPTTRDNANRYADLYRKALSDLLDRALRAV